MKTLNEFLLKHSDKWEQITETGCMIWTASLNNKGYGQAQYHGKVYLAHRMALIDEIGPPPDGTTASHLCNTPSCVNPAHLAWETHSQNMMRKSPEVRKMAATACGAARRRGAWGAYLDKRRRSWKSQAMHGRKLHHLGSFATEAEARAAYLKFIAALP